MSRVSDEEYEDNKRGLYLLERRDYILSRVAAYPDESVTRGLMLSELADIEAEIAARRNRP